MKLKNKVKELRARFNLTQMELAKRIGVSRQTISLIERGDYSPSIVIVLKLAKEFDVTVEEIFKLEEENNNEC